MTQRGLQNDSAIISIHLPNQELLEYPQKHALILHVQKPCQAHPADNTTRLPGSCRIRSIGTYFYSKYGLLLVFFGLHVVYRVDKDTYTIHPQVVQFLPDVLSSGTASSLIASLGIIPVIDDSVLFILFTVFFKFLTEIVDIFFRVLKLLSIHWFKQQFCQLFVKSFHKGLMGMLITSLGT